MFSTRPDVGYVPVSLKNGQVATEDVLKSVTENTCLISIMLANNETGVIMPVAQISKALKELNAERRERGLLNVFLHCDAAQAVGKIPVNVQELNVDYLTVAGHKVTRRKYFFESFLNLVVLSFTDQGSGLCSSEISMAVLLSIRCYSVAVRREASAPVRKTLP